MVLILTMPLPDSYLGQSARWLMNKRTAIILMAAKVNALALALPQPFDYEFTTYISGPRILFTVAYAIHPAPGKSRRRP